MPTIALTTAISLMGSGLEHPYIPPGRGTAVTFVAWGSGGPLLNKTVMWLLMDPNALMAGLFVSGWR